MAYIGRGIDNISQIEVLDIITFTNSAGPYNILKSSVAFLPSTPQSLLIEVDGIIQAPASYTITGSTITFGVSMPSSSTMNSILHFGTGIITTPADLSVTTAKIATDAVTNIKVADDAIGIAELSATGTASASNYLRGDNSWASVAADTNDKVSVSANDTTPSYLNGKLVAGTNISLTEGNDGGDETLTAAFTGNLNASVLNAGTVATARLGTGTADGTTFLRGDQTYAEPGGGLSVADQWRLTADFTGDAAPIASNLERVDTSGQGTLGSAMTESSGIFTFPSTGIYLVRYIMFQDSNDGTVRGYGGGAIFVTVNDSAYAAVANAYGSTPAIAGTSRMSNVCESLIDVTDVANVKVRFQTEMQNSAMKTFGSSTANKTTMTFLRLGDT
jgi:hypothetical protein